MKDIEPNTSSFAVVLTPEFENGTWNGAVSAHIEEDILDDLDVEELTKIRSVVGMMASTLTLMEADSELMEYIREHFVKNYQELIDEFVDDMQEKEPSFVRSKEGNVITLNFNTKTHGNA